MSIFGVGVNGHTARNVRAAWEILLYVFACVRVSKIYVQV